MLLIIEGKIVPVSITFALSILGIFGNLRVVFAAWTLRQSSTCHWFIFGRAILDILHQSGHFVTAFLVYTGKDTITHRICFILEFFPFAAVIGTSIVSLAIGIDRLIGFHMPFFYRRLNVTVYITAVYLITAGYALTFMTLFFLTSENMDEQWFCIPGSVISKAFMKPYLYAMAIIYAVTIIQYLSIWIPLFKHRKSMPGYMRIMKPITIVVCISLSGWLANFVFEIFVNSLNLNSMASTLWCGLTINLAVASDFWVYYIFSSDYRSTFAKQSILRKSRSCRIQTIMTAVYNMPFYSDRCKLFGITSLAARRLYFDLKLFHQKLSGDIDCNFELLLADSKTRGRARKVIIPKCRRSTRRSSFAIRASSAFTKLPRRTQAETKHLSLITEVSNLVSN